MEANSDGRKHVIAGFLREVWSEGDAEACDGCLPPERE